MSSSIHNEPTKSKSVLSLVFQNPFKTRKNFHTSTTQQEKVELKESESASEGENKPDTKIIFPVYEGVKQLVVKSQATKEVEEDEDEENSDDGVDEFQHQEEVNVEKEQKRYFRRIRAFLKRSGRERSASKPASDGGTASSSHHTTASHRPESSAEHIFLHPESHPALLLSRASAMRNHSFAILVLGAFVLCFFDFLKRVVLYYCNVPSDQPYFASPATIKAVIRTLSFMAFFILTAHRILASIAGVVLRVMLRGRFQSDGSFDIYCDWVSYRGFWDKNELVFGNLLWRNPPEFKKTPFLLACRELKVSFDLHDLFQTILYLKAIKFDEIVIDGLEVYFERNHTETTENSLNVWRAVGAKDKDTEKSIFHTILMGIWGAIKNRVRKQSLLHKLKVSLLAKSSVKHRDEEDGEFGHLNCDASDRASVRSSDGNPKPAASTKTSSTLPTVEFNRLNVYKLVAHPLDLLTRTQSQFDLARQNTILIPHFFMDHKDCTGKPKQKGGPRVALPADDFGDKFGDAFGAALVTNNSFAIASILAHSYMNRTLDAVKENAQRLSITTKSSLLSQQVRTISDANNAESIAKLTTDTSS